MNYVDRLTELLGKEWLEVENPETLELLILKKHGQPADDISYNFVNAIKALTANIIPWAVFHVFENIVDALNYNSVIPEVVTSPTCEEIAYAVAVMNSINSIEFHDDVAKYIAAKAQDEDILWLPVPLDFVNPFLLLPDDHELRDLQIQIENEYKKIENPEDTEFPETPLGIQLYRAIRIKLSSSLDRPPQPSRSG